MSSKNSSYDPPLRPGGDAKALQERLHELISRVSDTTDVVKSWPESSGDDASIHVKTTSKLIHSIREIIKAIERVEGVAKKDDILWKKLQECPIPLDLLEMMDASSLNPEMFMRGLLREALSQLAGLRRRKVALTMLGEAIQKGLSKKRGREEAGEESSSSPSSKKARVEKESTTTTSNKRSRDDDASSEPPTKMAKA